MPRTTDESPMSNNTDTPAFLEIHPILTSTITQYFHPLPFIGQYFSTPLSNPLPHSSLYIPTLPCSSTEPPTCERKSPAPELHPKAPYLTPQRRRLPEAERWDFRACCTWRSRFACCSDAADSPSDPPSVSRTTTPRLPPRRPEGHCSRAGPPTSNVDTEWSGSACPRTSLRGCKVWV